METLTITSNEMSFVVACVRSYTSNQTAILGQGAL